MTDSHEMWHDQPASVQDPHFDLSVALPNLSSEALEGIIAVRRAQEHADQAENTATAEEPDPQVLLTHYLQNPDAQQG